MNNTYQLTVRGIDARTKELLKHRAAQEGVSLNKLAYKSLRQTAGSDSQEERYQRMKASLRRHKIPHAEIQRVQEAIRLHKQTSLEKQKRDEHDLSL